jgi:type II secretory pathway component PulM
VKFDWRQTFSFYQRLSSRERTLVGVAGGALLVILLYTLVWDPLAQGRELLTRHIALREHDLSQMEQMRETYLELLRQYEASQAVLDRVDEKFSLFPHIEATVSQVVGRDHIISMNPQNKVIADAYRQESVELKLSSISLEQLVNMLYQIEKGPHPLRVTRLQVKKRIREPHSFDITATVSMLKALNT